MASSDPRTTIRDFLITHTGESAIPDELDIFERGLVNSMFVLQLVMFVEREFGFTVGGADLDFDHFRSIDSIDQFVAGKLPAT